MVKKEREAENLNSGVSGEKLETKDTEQQKSGRVRSKLLVCLLYVAVLSTATYAWFTLNNKPKVFNLSLTAGASADLLVADDLGGGPGEYGEELDLQEARQDPVAMDEMELNPVTTSNAETFYAPVYSGDTVTNGQEIQDDEELYKSYVYKKTFYLKAGSLKSKSGRKVSNGTKKYDIMLLGQGDGEEHSGCVVKQASGSSGEASAANSIRIAFVVENSTDDIPIYEPNSSQHNGGDKAVNGVSYGDYETMKQPSEGAPFEGGEDGNSKKLFTITEEEDVLVTMLVWIEGTDDDCTNSIQMDEIIGNIQFTSKDAQSTGR